METSTALIIAGGVGIGLYLVHRSVTPSTVLTNPAYTAPPTNLQTGIQVGGTLGRTAGSLVPGGGAIGGVVGAKLGQWGESIFTPTKNSVTVGLAKILPPDQAALLR